MIKPIMVKTRLLIGPLLAAFFLAGGSQVVQAQNDGTAGQRKAQAAQAARIGPGQAANIAQSATGAKVLAVKFRRGFYRVKLLRNNGVVFSVRVDAYTGRIK